ncbi:TPA: hypothetical protein ACOEFN_001009 [Stenotrophomonas maltophilia]
MTTDNKTLADVQPGGRVRLGDQAERARFEVWAEGASLNIARFNDGGYCDERTVSAWLAWLSAQQSPATCKEGLQVQPSPSGQGDTRIPFETWAKDGGFDVSKFKGIYNSLETRAAWEAWLYWQRRSAQPSPAGQGDALTLASNRLQRLALECPHGSSIRADATDWAAEALAAARQPVGATDKDSLTVGITAEWVMGYLTTGAPEESREAIRNAFAEYAALSGARQPVGEPITVEAVATVRRNGDGDRYIDWLTEGGIADLEVGDVLMVSDRAITDEDGSGELYTAPPGCAE